MGKQTICIGENKDADQLRGNREADQRLCFGYPDSTIPLLDYLNPKFQASSSFLCLYRPVCVRPLRKPHCWFSHEAAQTSAVGSKWDSNPSHSQSEENCPEFLTTSLLRYCMCRSRRVQERPNTILLVYHGTSSSTKPIGEYCDRTYFCTYPQA